MDKLSIRNFGPIKEANVQFGDFTILVGPQASGKSIFLQLLKLLEDRDGIIYALKNYGYVWRNATEFLEVYFGEGMINIWNDNTTAIYDNLPILKSDVLNPLNEIPLLNSIVYVPAQRILTLQNGWPRPFSDYSIEYPYVIKSFSELIRATLDLSISITIFPTLDKTYLSYAMYNSIFYGGEIELDKSTLKKRLILNIDNNKFPFMTWSAGQKEFMPLLLVLSMLFKPSISERGKNKIIIIEEPEMGLHPKAIKELIFELLRLISFGYKVVISTHSPVFLEFAWAFKLLQQGGVADNVLYELFDINPEETPSGIFNNILDRSVRTYYFDKTEDGVIVKDISSLDAGSDDPSIADWGGLSSFASKAGEIVSKYGPDDE